MTQKVLYLLQVYFFILALSMFVINDVTCARKRQLEERQLEERQLEERKLQEQQWQEPQLQERQLEEQQVDERQLQEQQQETHRSKPEIAREVNAARAGYPRLSRHDERAALALERKEVERRIRMMLPVV